MTTIQFLNKPYIFTVFLLKNNSIHKINSSNKYCLKIRDVEYAKPNNDDVGFDNEKIL